jgi:hypothetical protein
MPQQIRKRRQTTVQYQANDTQIERLGRGMIYRELHLQLNYTLATTVESDVTAATIQRGDEWAIVKNIRIIANGSDVLRNFTGNQLRWLNKLVYGFNPRNPLAGGAAAGEPAAISSSLVLPFWSIGTVRPLDTALDARQLTSLEIEIEWGDVTSVTDNAGASLATNPTLKVYSLESFGVEADFAQSRVFKIQESSVAVNDQHEVDIPVGSMYRGFLINTSASGADAANLSNIKLKSGTTVFVDQEAALLRDIANMRHGVHVTFDEAGTFEDSVFVSNNSNLAGWHYLDLVTDGRLKEALDTLGLAELTLELDVNTETDITVLPLQIIPVRGGNGNG